MYILFAGASAFSIPSLTALHKKKYDLQVLSSYPKAAGRGRHARPSPTERYAREHNITVHTPPRLTNEFIDSIVHEGYDMLVCVSYGKIFGPRFLSLFNDNALNVHPSLLPKYRGPSPIAASLINGDTITGVCVQRMVQGMDEGDILMSHEEQISDHDNHSSLQERLSVKGGELLVNVLANYSLVLQKALPQNDDESVYCTKISPEHGKPNFAQDASRLHNIIRGMEGHGGVRVCLRDDTIRIMSSFVVTNRGTFSPDTWGRICAITREGIHVQVARGIIGFSLVQRAGKRIMNAFDFANGLRIQVGEKFSPLRAIKSESDSVSDSGSESESASGSSSASDSATSIREQGGLT